MATTTDVPVEVYLRSSYEPDADYVDGTIEERSMGDFDHANRASRLPPVSDFSPPTSL